MRTVMRTIRRENKSAWHTIDDASFPRHPTHILSTRLGPPTSILWRVGGAALLVVQNNNKRALPQPAHGHSSIECTHEHASIQRLADKRAQIRPNPRANRELATTPACVDRAFGHTRATDTIAPNYPDTRASGGSPPGHTTNGSRCLALGGL